MRKHLYIPIAVFATLLTFTSSGIASEQTFNDASNMFNERGYAKGAHEVSNGKVSINNYNGNLIYEEVLFHVPGRNGLDLTLKLTYNANVQHMSPNYYAVQAGNSGINYIIH